MLSKALLTFFHLVDENQLHKTACCQAFDRLTKELWHLLKGCLTAVKLPWTSHWIASLVYFNGLFQSWYGRVN